MTDTHSPADARGRAPGLAGIVLAAGGASRFGSPKQAALLDGVPLVARAAQLALSFCPAGVVVVKGANADVVTDALAGIPVPSALNRDWQSGVAASLRCGVAALPCEASACLVMLCDQPAIDEGDLGRLIAAWAAAPEHVAAARYAGTTGVPAIFPASFWHNLRTLDGDRGACGLIASLRHVTVIEMPHAACDIDTLADLEGARDAYCREPDGGCTVASPQGVRQARQGS